MSTAKKFNIEDTLRISKPESFGVEPISKPAKKSPAIKSPVKRQLTDKDKFAAKILPFGARGQHVEKVKPKVTPKESKQPEQSFMVHELHRSEEIKKSNSTKEAIDIYTEVLNSNYKPLENEDKSADLLTNRLCGTLINKKHY